MDIREYYLGIISGEKNGIISLFIRGFLYLISIFYSFIMDLRLILYKTKILKTEKLPCYVLSIGNLTWGGTGKTPMAEKVSQILSKNNIFHAVISRGYKSRDSNSVNIVSTPEKILLKPPYASDEAAMLAGKLKGIPVITGKNRFSAGKLAIEKYGVKAVILDDGYQHIRLGRDLNILLIDSSREIERDSLIPGGTLREPFESIRRADLIVLTKTNQGGKKTEKNYNFAKSYNSAATVIKAIHKIEEVVEFKSGKSFESDFLKGKEVLAFSAIGSPVSFKNSLKELEVKVSESVEFKDHHCYSMKEAEYISEKAKKLKVKAIVTTEKDIARSSDILSHIENLFFLRLSVNLDEEEKFEKIILKYFDKL